MLHTADFCFAIIMECFLRRNTFFLEKQVLERKPLYRLGGMLLAVSKQDIAFSADTTIRSVGFCRTGSCRSCLCLLRLPLQSPTSTTTCSLCTSHYIAFTLFPQHAAHLRDLGKFRDGRQPRNMRVPRKLKDKRPKWWASMKFGTHLNLPTTAAMPPSLPKCFVGTFGCFYE